MNATFDRVFSSTHLRFCVEHSNPNLITPKTRGSYKTVAHFSPLKLVLNRYCVIRVDIIIYYSGFYFFILRHYPKYRFCDIVQETLSTFVRYVFFAEFHWIIHKQSTSGFTLLADKIPYYIRNAYCNTTHFTDNNIISKNCGTLDLFGKLFKSRVLKFLSLLYYFTLSNLIYFQYGSLSKYTSFRQGWALTS